MTHSPWARKPLTAEVFRHISRYNGDFEAVRAFAVGQDICDSKPDDPRPQDDDMSLRCVSRHVLLGRDNRGEGDSTISYCCLGCLILRRFVKICRNAEKTLVYKCPCPSRADSDSYSRRCGVSAMSRRLRYSSSCHMLSERPVYRRNIRARDSLTSSRKRVLPSHTQGV
jgi:hypothetical protein